jgi:hypothetical protein
MVEENRAPYLLPIALVLAVFMWVFTTGAGQHILVKEVLGEAYDSQAEHFLRGDAGVDVEAIRHEAMIVEGKVCMYFGPFPAFLRLPLNYVYPEGRGRWSRISGFCAGIIALFAFAGLMGAYLRSSTLSPWWRSWIGNACVVGFALGSPLLLLLGNLSIYNEAILWGLAWSLGAMFFLYRARGMEGRALTCNLLGFSFCAAGSLLSRVTFGAPFLLIAPLLAAPLFRKDQISRLAALVLPLGAALLFHLLLSYAKFGTFLGVSYEHYINPVHRQFAHKYGVFSLQRVPYSFADYFNWRLPEYQNRPPFLRAERHSYDYPSFYSLPFSETYSSIMWSSSWLVLGAIMGIVCLFRPGRTGWLERGIAAALFAQFLLLLSFHTLAQRYATDLYPFLIFALLVFLGAGGSALLRLRYVLIGLVVLSITINSLATVSWLAEVDMNVGPETRAMWNVVLGRTASH